MILRQAQRCRQVSLRTWGRSKSRQWRPLLWLLPGLLATLISASLQAGVDCGGSQLNFPRLSFEPRTLTGAAVVNPNDIPAPITITAYDSDGNPLQGAGVVNPVADTIEPNTQFARLATDIFGVGDPQQTAWFQVCSPVPDLTGFFLFLNNPTTLMDGSDLPVSAQKIVFNDVRVAPGLDTELNIINPGATDAEILVQIFRGDSAIPLASGRFDVRAKGALRFDVGVQFDVSDLESGGTAVVTSEAGAPVAGFELLHPVPIETGASGEAQAVSPATSAALPEDTMGLNARPALEKLETLFFPQLAVGEGIDTEISVTNYTTQAEIVTISAYRPDGQLWGAPQVSQNRVTRNLAGGATVRLAARELFGFSDQDTFQGWIKVEGTRAAGSINGSVSYFIGESLAAVSSLAEGRTSAIFSHLATTRGFFTGVAGLNAGAYPVNVKIVAMAPSGRTLGEYRTVLTQGQRFSELVSNVIPEAAGRAGGILWVKSDLPLYLTSLFGTSDVLANIPPQRVPIAYRPDQGKGFLAIEPVQVPVEPNSVQNFVNNDGGSTTWRVNHLDNPDVALGRMAQNGDYTAPDKPPAPPTVTISASTSDNIGASAVDILVSEEFLSGFGVLRSLVHLESLDALYSVELFAAGGSGVAAAPAGAQTTKVVEIRSEGDRQELISFAGQEISKALPFEASNQKEYLILANRTTGSVLGLDPASPTPILLQTGFDQPSTMAYDVDGNLVVADLAGFHLIREESLDDGLLGSPVASLPLTLFGPPGRGPRNQISGTPGIAFDRCTGDLFVSDPGDNSILRLDRSTGELTTSFADVLGPGQLLGFYRREVGCPFGFNLLVAERGRDRILLINPGRGFRSGFAGVGDARDLVFLPRISNFSQDGTVLIAQGTGPAGAIPSGGEVGKVFRIDVPELWRERPPNAARSCLGSFLLRDTTLHSAVTRVLGMGINDRVPCGQAASLSELDLSGVGVVDLENIGFFSGVSNLNLRNNRVRDLNPLADLPGLTTLDLTDNLLSDLTPLQLLTALRHLEISWNLDVRSAEPLSPLLRLQILRLNDTGIADLDPLRGLSELRQLSLARNGVNDISPLASMSRLQYLELLGNRIADLTPLSAMSDLQILYLAGNRVTDLSPIADLRRMRILDLGGNEIADLEPLRDLSALVELRIDSNQIGQLDALAGLVGLEKLVLNQNRITSLAPLLGNPGLGAGDEVDARGNSLSASTCSDIATLRQRGVQVLIDDAVTTLCGF